MALRAIDLENARADVENRPSRWLIATASKAVSEQPLMTALREGYAPPDDPVLRSLAEGRRDTVRLSPESPGFLIAKHGETGPAAAGALNER